MAALCCGAHQTIGGIYRLFRKCSGGNVDTRALSINRSKLETPACFAVYPRLPAKIVTGTSSAFTPPFNRNPFDRNAAAQATCAPQHKWPAHRRTSGLRHAVYTAGSPRAQVAFAQAARPPAQAARRHTGGAGAAARGRQAPKLAARGLQSWRRAGEIRGALAQGCSLVNEEWRPQFIARNRDGPRRDDVYAAVFVSHY